MKSGKSVILFSVTGLLLSALCSLAARFTKGVLHSNFRFVSELLTIIVCVRLAVWAYRSIRSKKVGKRLFGWLKAAIKKAAKKINRSVYRFTNRHGSRLHRYQDHVEFLGASDKNHRFQPFRRLKWRDMNTESERVRYIYIEYIKKAIKTGFRFRSSQTPNEIGALFSRLDNLSNSQLFDLYNRARYAEKDGITPEDVQNLLISTGKKHRKA